MKGMTKTVNGKLDDIGEALAGLIAPDASGMPKIAVISDENTAGLYLDRCIASLERSAFSAFPIVVPPGESSKNGASFLRILEAMAEIPLTRTDMAAVLGGGVPGDMGGFAAATYMRGIPVVQIPTTLLAMVDSAIGGKTGIDLSAGKNLAGAIHEPVMVYTDTSLLRTLPESEFRSGMAEVVKYGLICGEPLFSMTEAFAEGGCGDFEALEKIIDICREAKLGIVEGDVTDKGKRQILNLGHTAGHAAEKASGYSLTHGEAVSMGLVWILTKAADAGLAPAELRDRTAKLLGKIGLPTDMPFAGAELFDIIKNDKKRKGNFIDLAVPEDLGKCTLKRVSMEELREMLG